MSNRKTNKVNPWSTILVITGLVIAIGIYVYYLVANNLGVEESARIISIGSIIAFFSLLFDVWKSYGTKKTASEAMDGIKKLEDAIINCNDKIEKISSPKQNSYVKSYEKLRLLQSKVKYIVANYKDDNGIVLTDSDQKDISALFEGMYADLESRGDIEYISKCIRPLYQYDLKKYKYTKKDILSFAEPLLEALEEVEKSF